MTQVQQVLLLVLGTAARAHAKVVGVTVDIESTEARSDRTRPSPGTHCRPI
jgi:hypothetical protein